MLDRRALARESARRALSLRKRSGFGWEDAVSPIDTAEKMAIDVRFVDIASMEGIYVAGAEPRIILSCLRPQGRRNFTCAHEIGHHVLGHGQQFDEIIDHRSARRSIDPQEFSADCFAAYFLMPKVTVDVGMSRRGFRYDSITAPQAYAMSSWLGVGYQTFVNHLTHGLRVLGRAQSAVLLKSTPLSIRSGLVGERLVENLHVIDRSWSGRPADCEMGDYLLLPKGTLIEGSVFAETEKLRTGDLVRMLRPGLGRVSQGLPMWSAFVRVSRKDYVGRGRYRFEEEVNE
jgi:hypothetical protein